MRVELLTTITLFTCQFTFSQTEKILHGKVISQDITLKNVEVINKTSKTSTRTNTLGEFEIAVNVKDSLIFFSQGYYFKRIQLTQEDIVANNLIVNMLSKPKELDEVLILSNKVKRISLSKEEIEQIKLNKSRPKQGMKIEGYKDGIAPITHQADLIRIGKLLYSIIKKKEKKPETAELNFIQLVTNTLDPKFFTKDLKLKPEEKEPFLKFCDADPKSKKLIENNNILKSMDFLFGKIEEFKKLKVDKAN